jgi:hypothetical protein
VSSNPAVHRLKARLRERRSREPRPTTVVTLLAVAPCVHEGGILERCHTCNGEGRHVRECDLHGTCTRDAVSPKVRACATCADRKPAEPA